MITTDPIISIPSNCPHTDTVTRVLEAAINCELTAVFCAECNEQLTNSKTECA